MGGPPPSYAIQREISVCQCGDIVVIWAIREQRECEFAGRARSDVTYHRRSPRLDLRPSQSMPWSTKRSLGLGTNEVEGGGTRRGCIGASIVIGALRCLVVYTLGCVHSMIPALTYCQIKHPTPVTSPILTITSASSSFHSIFRAALKSYQYYQKQTKTGPIASACLPVAIMHLNKCHLRCPSRSSLRISQISQCRREIDKVVDLTMEDLCAFSAVSLGMSVG